MLTQSTPYTGSGNIQVANGEKLLISHIGNTFISTFDHELVLDKLVHVPNVTKNLLFVSQFAKDNNVFFKFYPYSCLVNDLVTKAVLLNRKVDKGLYKLNFHSFLCTHNFSNNNGDDFALFQQDKQVLHATTTTTTRPMDHTMCTPVNVHPNDVSFKFSHSYIIVMCH